MKQYNKNIITHANEQGIITPLILIITSVMLIFATALIEWSLTEHRDAKRKIRTTQALQIAEAGVNYYKWHLEHDDSDYQDGNDWCCDGDPDKGLIECGGFCGGESGYIHQYIDYNDEIIGRFSLKITPPEVGSTIALIESTGYAYNDASNKKKITSRVGKRSRAEYSWLSNEAMTFSHTSTTTGPVHSNKWINFRGTCGAEVTSADSVYANCLGETPCPMDCPESFWQSGAPTIDFDDFKKDLRDIKREAAADDAVPPEDIGTCDGSAAGRGICYGDSGAAGYWVVFGGYVSGGGSVVITGNPIVSVYKIDALKDPVNYWGGSEAEEPDDVTTLLENHTLPDNGLIFLEDDVWVEGTISGRVTVGATKFLSGEARIRINGDLEYADKLSGDDNLGLICQGDILIPKLAPSDLIISASLLSQQGKGLFFRNYSPPVIKTRIENYGGIITFESAGIKYGSPVENGYITSVYTYNNNLTFNPPPSFPTADNFEALSWEEK